MPLTPDVIWLLSYVVLATAGAIVSILMPLILAPRARGLVKEDRYECGQSPPPYGRRKLSMQYYAFLLIFLAFDVIGFIVFIFVYSFKTVGLGSLVVLSFLILVLLPPLLVVRRLAEDVRQWW